MKKQKSLEELSTMIQAFCEERDWDQFHSAKDLAIGLITEASELLEHFRFQSESQIQSLLENSKSKQDIEDELSDVFFFVLRFAQRFEIDLSSSLEKKLKKSALKYPVAQARGSNKKYTELKND